MNDHPATGPDRPAKDGTITSKDLSVRPASVTGWVYCGVDYAAHLLRHGATAPCVVTARCGQDVRLPTGAQGHPDAPERACRVCVQLRTHDRVCECVEALLTAPDQEPLTDKQRQALEVLRGYLAARRHLGG